jgi:hypothetical protein
LLDHGERMHCIEPVIHKEVFLLPELHSHSMVLGGLELTS